MYKNIYWRSIGLVICFLVVVSVQFINQSKLSATVTSQDGFVCGNSGECTLSILYDASKGSLLNQANQNIALISPEGNKRIREIIIYPNATNDAISHTEWLSFRDQMLRGSSSNPNYRYEVERLTMEGVKMELDILPDEAFMNTQIQYLVLPDIIALGPNTLLKATNLDYLTLPKTLTTMDVNTLKNTDSDWGLNYNFIRSEVSVQSDICDIYQALQNIRIEKLSINTDTISNTNQPILKDTLFENVRLNGNTKINVDLNTWYDVSNPMDAQTIPIKSFYGDISIEAGVNVSNLESFTAQGFRNLTSFLSSSVEKVIIKDCGLQRLGNTFTSSKITELDVSGNYIDFTDSKNASVYLAHQTDPKFQFSNQCPDLNIQAMSDFNVVVGDSAPMITPSFQYADKSAVDFDQVPSWMDATYASTYAANVTYKDSPTLDMNVAGTYTRTYYSPNHNAIGSVKTIVSEAVTSLETPTISLTLTPNTNVTTDTEVAMEASLSQSGTGKNLDTNATVKFYDGATLLDTVIVNQGKAVCSKQKLTQGTHTIKAVYSGNTEFASVEESEEIIVSTATKQSQTISFEKSEVNVTYKDTIINPYTKSESTSTGTLTFTSSDPTIASVDASSGEVTIHKIGTVTISASISEDAQFQSASASYTIKINPKELSLHTIQVKDKVYDGTKLAQFTASPTLSEVCAGDDVTLQQGSIEFDSVHAGTHTIVFKDFVLAGADQSNYILKLPTITQTITKKPATIQIQNQTMKQKEQIPSFTYTIDGLVQEETQDSIDGLIQPKLQCSADQTSAAGDYAITGSGASATDYSFTYIDGTLTITANSTDEKTQAYEIQGSKGKEDWYVSETKIIPKNEYTQIWDGTAWTSSLTLPEGIHSHIKFKLRKKDGTESDEYTINELKVDTISPSIEDLDQDKQYLLNRVFSFKDQDIKKITIDGTEVDFVGNHITLDASETKEHHIVIEDQAGNLTTYIVSTKNVQDYFKAIIELKDTSVSKQDRLLLEQYKQEVEALLKDISYTPTKQQKEQLNELQNHIDELLKVLENQQEIPSNDQTQKPDNQNKDTVTPPVNSVNTGDPTTFMSIWFGLISLGILLVLSIRKSISNQ